MKRLLRLLVIPLLLLGVTVVMPPHALAAPDTSGDKQLAACTNQYDGKTLKKGSAALASYKANCGSVGCTTQNVKAGVKIDCSGASSSTATTNANSNDQCKSSTVTATGNTNSSNQDASGSSDAASGIPNACDPAVTQNCNKSDCNIISNYVNPVIFVLSALVGLAVVIGIIVGAIQIISSTGDPQKNANGRRHIQNAIIALVAYLLLYAFLKFLLPGVTQ